jgi:hypothetical protein
MVHWAGAMHSRSNRASPPARIRGQGNHDQTNALLSERAGRPDRMRYDAAELQIASVRIHTLNMRELPLAVQASLERSHRLHKG